MRYKPAEMLGSRARWLIPLLLASVFKLVGSPPLLPPPLASADARNIGAQLPKGLDPLIPNYPATVETALKTLKSMVGEYRDKRYDRAIAMLPDTASGNSTAVPDFFVLYRAKSSLALDNAEAALKDFRLLQGRYPESSLTQEAILGEAQASLKLRDPRAALAVLKNPKLEQTAEVLYLRGRAHEEAGNRKEAMELYLRVYADYAAAEVSSRAFQRLVTLSPKSATAAANYPVLLHRAENLLRAGKNRDARALLLKMGGVKPPEPASGERRNLLLGEAEFNLKRSTTALTYLKKITDQDPSIHARSLYLQGAAYHRLKKEALFLKVRDTALRLHPQSPFTEKLLYSVATYFDLDGRPDPAREAYRTIAEKFPKGEHSERALWKLALFSYTEGNYQEALQWYWKHLRSFPEPTTAVAPIYWMGRCYEKVGDRTRAADLYARVRALSIDGYYGQRAAEAQAAMKEPRSSTAQVYNGIDYKQVTRLLDDLSLPSGTISQPAGPVAEAIERARQLAAAELPDLALAELRAAARLFPHEKALSFVISRVYETQEDFYGAIVTLRKAFPDYADRPFGTLPKEVWQLLFPVRYWDSIVTQSEIHRVDPALILGIIRQESAFREGARSLQNARGLMQVLPKTGRSLARKANVSRYSTQKLYQAKTNIALGIRHLASLLQKYDQTVELALAAYNAGDDRVNRWLKEFGEVDRAEFVERIPFSETRTYLKLVLANRAHYRRLTPPSPIAAP